MAERETSRAATKRLLLLRLLLGDGDVPDPPVYFVKELHEAWNHWDDDALRYHFDERTCPKDIIGVETVIEGDDDDPHGIFEFVQAVHAPADWPFTGFVDKARYKRLFDKMV